MGFQESLKVIPLLQINNEIENWEQHKSQYWNFQVENTSLLLHGQKSEKELFIWERKITNKLIYWSINIDPIGTWSLYWNSRLFIFLQNTHVRATSHEHGCEYLTLQFDENLHKIKKNKRVMRICTQKYDTRWPQRVCVTL